MTPCIAGSNVPKEQNMSDFWDDREFTLAGRVVEEKSAGELEGVVVIPKCTKLFVSSMRRVAGRLLWRMKYCLSSIIAATIATTTTVATTTTTIATTTCAAAAIGAAATATITGTVYVAPLHVSSSFSSFFIVLPLITTILLIVPEQAHSTATVTEHRC
ncbi:unnamed protein product [Acanthocheilonema viteae]|uniref:Uncharacterized protein n=1 Tax=Acanthocheilonema viteae TaxID=6277 RepID=A0A498SHS2_ACAVI|nr:unnamed protein product [Acanthocheilonema viteae]